MYEHEVVLWQLYNFQATGYQYELTQRLDFRLTGLINNVSDHVGQSLKLQHGGVENVPGNEWGRSKAAYGWSH